MQVMNTKKSSKMGLIIGIVAAVIVGLGVGAYFFLKGRDAKNEIVEQSVEIEMQEDLYGTIAGVNATMSLTKYTDGRVEGTYYYDSQRAKGNNAVITFSGTATGSLYDENHIELVEKSEGKVTGRFVGTGVYEPIDMEYTFSGTFTRQSDGKTFAFRFVNFEEFVVREMRFENGTYESSGNDYFRVLTITNSTSGSFSFKLTYGSDNAVGLFEGVAHPQETEDPDYFECWDSENGGRIVFDYNWNSPTSIKIHGEDGFDEHNYVGMRGTFWGTYSLKPGSSSSSSALVRVTGTHVRLRKGPGTEYSIYSDSAGNPIYPDEGDCLEYVGQDGDWYNVSFKGQSLWISKQFSQLTK